MKAAAEEEIRNWICLHKIAAKAGALCAADTEFLQKDGRADHQGDSTQLS